ncbi:MAG: hypothetical protein ABSH20_13040, partial [Tepidisphaeraceae bacterium]
MDNKRLILVMAISFMLIMGWTYLSLWIQQKHPEWFPPKEQPAALTQPASTTQTAATRAAPTTAPVAA